MSSADECGAIECAIDESLGRRVCKHACRACLHFARCNAALPSTDSPWFTSKEDVDMKPAFSELLRVFVLRKRNAGGAAEGTSRRAVDPPKHLAALQAHAGISTECKL